METGGGKIPGKLRIEVWRKHNGSSLDGECYCCHHVLLFENFECGHVVARANGGPTNINNLVPICGSCNKSMGTSHLEEFRQMLTASPATKKVSQTGRWYEIACRGKTKKGTRCKRTVRWYKLYCSKHMPIVLRLIW